MTARAEVDALRQPFVAGVVLVLAVMVMVGGLIRVFGTGANRPEGAAERWLTAIADTTRDGVGNDARERADDLGGVVAGASLLPAVDTGGERAFADLEVGKAERRGSEARVPFRLHQFAESGQGPVLAGTVLLALDGDDEWRVLAVTERQRGELVPSEGGDPPARAALPLWLGGAALSASLCALASIAVRAATPLGGGGVRVAAHGRGDVVLRNPE